MVNSAASKFTSKDGHKPYLLTLFVTTYSTASHRAIINITQLLKDCYDGIYVLEIIDIKKEPQRAIQENIIYTPLLIKEKPFPSKRLMGDMSDRSKVMAAL